MTKMIVIKVSVIVFIIINAAKGGGTKRRYDPKDVYLDDGLDSKVQETIENKHYYKKDAYIKNIEQVTTSKTDKIVKPGKEDHRQRRDIEGTNHCKILNENMKKERKLGKLRMYINNVKPMKILVMSSNRSTSKALAALITAAIRHKAGYEDTVTRIVNPSTVNELAANVSVLTTTYFNDDKVYIHVDADWEESLYGPGLPNCPRHTQSCSIAGSRLQDFGTTLIPDLLVYAVSIKSIDAKCSLFFHNQTMLETCGFNKTNEERCIPVYLVPEVYSENLDIDFKLKSLTGDIPFCKNVGIERNELTQRIQGKESSFIFIDYDNMEYQKHEKNGKIIRVLPDLFTPTKKIAYRLADLFLFLKYAPKISDILNTTMPQLEDLHGILELNSLTKNIDEAACAWSNNNLEKFNKWTNTADRGVYFLAVICKGELERKYKDIINNILNTHSFFQENIKLFKYKLYSYALDCTKPNAISDIIINTSKRGDVVDWGGIIVPAVEAILVSHAALKNNVSQMIFYDLPPTGTKLENMTSTVSGKLSLLVRSYLNYFKKRNWQRIAVISEDSDVARSITKELRPFILLKEKILHRIDNIDRKQKERIISEVMISLRNDNARVFFLNVGYETANIIACVAAILDMKDGTQFAWIAREWYPTEEMCGKDVKISTVSYWWQGGNETLIKYLDGNADIRLAIDKQMAGLWPVLAAPMVDAFIMMTMRMQRVLSNHSEFTYALRHPEYFGNLSQTGNYPTPGVVKHVIQEEFTQSRPHLYIYEWQNYTNKLIGLWKANSEDNEIEIIFEHFNGDSVQDERSDCTTTYSGDKFNPFCHTAIWACSPVVFLVLVLSLLWLHRVRLAKSKKRKRELIMRLLSRCERTAEVLRDYLVDRSCLELFEELGHGHFGRVRFGMLRARNRIPTSVAAKTLRVDAAPAEEAEFLREGSTMASLSHDNIVRLIGVCADAEEPPLLLMEHAFFKDLLQYLRQRRHFAEIFERISKGAGDLEPFQMLDDPQSLDPEAQHVSPPELTRLARETAAAVDYLSSKHILHRDIRAANCLVDTRRTLKLADFGMARKVDAKDKLPGEPEESEDYKYICRRRGIFPVPWMAPESLERGEFSRETDVWALGVLILEIATLGARPYGTWQPIQILRYVQSGGRPQLPIDVSYHTCEVTEKCWTEDPSQRATAKEIHTFLTDHPRAIRPALRPALPELDCACTLDGTDSGFGEKVPEYWPKGVDLRVSTL
ncbi:protein tyrosine kinase domain-containing protein [Phthorimaea operculella]|nr:protein tyrosine kinase domain-containing protein [Phthorimaea operculella]